MTKSLTGTVFTFPGNDQCVAHIQDGVIAFYERTAWRNAGKLAKPLVQLTRTDTEALIAFLQREAKGIHDTPAKPTVEDKKAPVTSQAGESPARRLEPIIVDKAMGEWVTSRLPCDECHKKPDSRRLMRFAKSNRTFKVLICKECLERVTTRSSRTPLSKPKPKRKHKGKKLPKNLRPYPGGLPQ